MHQTQGITPAGKTLKRRQLPGERVSSMVPASAEDPLSHAPAPASWSVFFPDADAGLEQDSEWCIVARNGDKHRLRLHDYARIYSLPGLYEDLFCKRLRCLSPFVVCRQLEMDLLATGASSSELKVIDVGAGNGMVGEELRRIGADVIVGVDIVEEAAEAALRDRPDVYTDYQVLDLTELSDEQCRELGSYQFNCLTCVAALGFGDIPPAAFAAAYNLVVDNGWVAFNIKEEFLTDPSRSPFSRLIKSMIGDGTLSILSKRRYRHRFSISGKPLYYVAFVGRKRRDVPQQAAEL